jgi:G:T/U-mismatch repair DNA glycosylase
LNGVKAAGYRHLITLPGVEIVVLPSSSPANATLSLAAKQLRWKQHLDWQTSPQNS